MGSPATTQLMLLFMAVAVVAALCGFLAAAVVHGRKRPRKRAFLVGVLCGLLAGRIVGGRRPGAKILKAIGTTSRRSWLTTTTAAVSVLAVLAALIGLGTPMAAAAPKCNDIEIVFARGTTEPAGLGAVGKALVYTLRPMMPGQSIGAYAVKYPASWDFTQVATGANDASKRIQSIAATCPASKIVLGGYSQGAAVIDVGVSEVDGKLVGDVDTEGVQGTARIVTPHRRGVGPMTVTMLLSNTLDAFEARLGG